MKHKMTCIFCRYDYPKSPQGLTEVSDDGVKQARSIGSEYLNGLTYVLTSLTKSNNDLRLLGISIDYAVKYTSKSQGLVNSNEALNVISKAISRSCRGRKRAESRDPEMVPTKRGEARVRSLLYHITNFTKLFDTQINLLLLSKSRPFLTSHRIVNLSLFPLIALVTLAENVTVAVQRTDDGGARGSMVAAKYSNRKIRSLAMFPFYSNGHHVQRRQSGRRRQTRRDLVDDEAAESPDEEEEELECDDGQARTDESSPKDFTVVVHGHSFKPLCRRNTPERRERHALAALLLFVPFENLDALSILNGHATFEEA